MAIFIKSSLIRAPVERVFAFHERDDALELLTPPFPPTHLISKANGIKTGARVVMQVGFTKWTALHTDYELNKLFVDEQVSGPFRRWIHRHEFEAIDANSSRLTDRIEYELPGGPLVTACLGWVVKMGLAPMFRRRHQVTRQYCEGAI